MNPQLVIQSLALIALAIWASSYHFKERKTILLVQLGSVVFLIIHFILLEAYSGAALATLGAIRLALFSFKTKDNWISKPVVLYFFIAALLIVTILTFSTYWVVFALIGGIFAVIASWQHEKDRIRLLFIPSHICWIMYDLFVGSYGGAISETVLGLSALISFMRRK